MSVLDLTAHAMLLLVTTLVVARTFRGRRAPDRFAVPDEEPGRGG